MFWILGAILLITLFYYFGIKPLFYWKERGVKQDDLWTLLFSNWFSLFRRLTFYEFANELFGKFPGSRYFGSYMFNQPSLMIKDVDLLKQMTIRDYEHFNEHRAFAKEDVDPMWAKNLFALTGNRWRQMRSTLSPSFTSSKMKGMFLLMTENAQRFIDFFLKQNKDIVEIEMKDVSTRYCTDVIASAAFGLEVDSLTNANNDFYLKGKELTDLRSIYATFRFLVNMFASKLAKIFDIRIICADVGDYFNEILENTIKLREEKGIVRTDMIQLLVDAKKGNVKVDEHNNTTDTGFATVAEHLKAEGNAQITNQDIIAQALVFFFAGYDSSSTLMSYMAYELLVNQDVQEKLRDEIRDTLENCNHKLTYDALVTMQYMDMVVSETLRKWPSNPGMDRVCTKPYIIQPVTPEEKPVYLEVGDMINMPIYGIHHNPELFPDPETFDPERFSNENKSNIKPCSFQPFGLGPRNCIGSRFALLETKILFFYILKQFKIIPVDRTRIPPEWPKTIFTLIPTDGFIMGLQRV